MIHSDLLNRFLEVSSHVHAMEIDGRGRIVQVNPALARSLGLSEDAVIGLSA